MPKPLLVLLVGMALLVPDLQAQNGPVAISTPAHRLSHDFSQIGGVAELQGGRILVADSKDHLLYVVDPTTDRATQLGRQGQGPGEYQNTFGLVRWRGDTVLVYDPRNNQFLRVSPDGRIAGGLTIAAAARMGGLSLPRGADAEGRLYWDRVVLNRDPATGVKRGQALDLVRWRPGTETVDTIGTVADHAAAMHDQRFHPFAERDAWVVAPDGRIGVVVAAAYHLRWLGAGGKPAAEGPLLPNTPIAITSRDIAQYREARALAPAGGNAMTGSGGGTSSPAAVRRTMEEVYPDEMFPRFKPPFEEGGAWRSPGGEIWVARSRPTGVEARAMDVLDATGSLRRQVELPAGCRVVALERSGIYLACEDEDGLQFLQRHGWPAGWR